MRQGTEVTQMAEGMAWDAKTAQQDADIQEQRILRKYGHLQKGDVHTTQSVVCHVDGDHPHQTYWMWRVRTRVVLWE